MKKSILLFALAISTGFAASAQSADHFESDRLKPVQGDVAAEFGLTGGILNSDFTLNEGTSGLLRFRYFIKDDLALRIGANIAISNVNQKFYGTGTNEGKTTDFKSLTLVNLGLEKHFRGTHRLSPYVGGDLLLGFQTSKITALNNDGVSYVPNTKITQSGPGTFGVGLRGVFGTDFYIYKSLFIGAEAGLGALFAVEGKTKTTTTVGNSTSTVTHKSAGNNFSLSPSMVTGVRIGFVF